MDKNASIANCEAVTVVDHQTVHHLLAWLTCCGHDMCVGSITTDEQITGLKMLSLDPSTGRSHLGVLLRKLIDSKRKRGHSL